MDVFFLEEFNNNLVSVFSGKVKLRFGLDSEKEIKYGESKELILLLKINLGILEGNESSMEDFNMLFGGLFDII